MSTVSVYDFVAEVGVPLVCKLCAEAITDGRFRITCHEGHDAT